MTKDKKEYLILTIIIFILLLIWMCVQHNNDAEYNKIRCETIPLGIKGVISKVDGRAGYAIIFVNNQSYSFDVKSVKYKRGFGEYHIYAVGDSVFKTPNSKEVTIKNGDSLCIFTLECNN